MRCALSTIHVDPWARSILSHAGGAVLENGTCPAQGTKEKGVLNKQRKGSCIPNVAVCRIVDQETRPRDLRTEGSSRRVSVTRQPALKGQNAIWRDGSEELHKLVQIWGFPRRASCCRLTVLGVACWSDLGLTQIESGVCSAIAGWDCERLARVGVRTFIKGDGPKMAVALTLTLPALMWSLPRTHAASQDGWMERLRLLRTKVTMYVHVAARTSMCLDAWSQ